MYWRDKTKQNVFIVDDNKSLVLTRDITVNGQFNSIIVAKYSLNSHKCHKISGES